MHKYYLQGNLNMKNTNLISHNAVPISSANVNKSLNSKKFIYVEQSIVKVVQFIFFLENLKFSEFWLSLCNPFAISIVHFSSADADGEGI